MGGRWGTTGDFTTSFLHFSLFSYALWDLANSRPVHSLMLSSHLFFCPPCLLPPFTVPCKMILARPDEWETGPHHFSLPLFVMIRSSCGPIAFWILARTSSLVTWPLYEMCSIFQQHLISRAWVTMLCLEFEKQSSKQQYWYAYECLFILFFNYSWLFSSLGQLECRPTTHLTFSLCDLGDLTS